jgi:4-hydroxy-3-polyprenylbenzoate decarboxylase
MSKDIPYLIGITGASGSVYARRLVEELKSRGHKVEGVLSEAGQQVVKYEKESQIIDMFDVVYSNENFFSPPASGTSKYKAYIILPCSMGSLGKVANGVGDNLLTRAADVFIKEKKPLIIAPREMPYSAIHLENMLKLSKLNVTIASTNPFFYYHPQNIDELINTVVGKILDQLGIEHDLFKPWKQ